jgi:hypothetical protein
MRRLVSNCAGVLQVPEGGGVGVGVVALTQALRAVNCSARRRFCSMSVLLDSSSSFNWAESCVATLVKLISGGRRDYAT